MNVLISLIVVLIVLLMCIVCVAGGFLLCKSVCLKENKAEAVPLTDEEKRKVELKEREYQNFLNYDGTPQN